MKNNNATPSGWLTHTFSTKVLREAKLLLWAWHKGNRTEEIGCLSYAPSTHRLVRFKKLFTHSMLGDSLSRLQILLSLITASCWLFLILPFPQTGFTLQFICFGTDVSLDGTWFLTWFSPSASVLQITLGTGLARLHSHSSNQNPSPANSLTSLPQCFVLDGIQKSYLIDVPTGISTAEIYPWEEPEHCVHWSWLHLETMPFLERVEYGVELADPRIRELGLLIPLTA